jgi:hypothetical protein
VAGLLLENKRLKSDPDELELLRLRGEIGRLKDGESRKQKNQATELAAKTWLDKVNQLKTYMDQHPEKKMPEFQYLTFTRWLSAAEAGDGLPQNLKDTDEYYRSLVESLRQDAEVDFGAKIQNALKEYAQANRGQFPEVLSELKPYCEPDVAEILQQNYEIKPASIVPPDQRKELNIKSDWIIVRKHRSVANSTSRAAYFTDGFAWWQSPPGTDEP